MEKKELMKMLNMLLKQMRWKEGSIGQQEKGGI
jgi:hypothetical protein